MGLMAMRGSSGGLEEEAPRACREDFPCGQTLEWAQELDRWGARPA